MKHGPIDMQSPIEKKKRMQRAALFLSFKDWTSYCWWQWAHISSNFSSEKLSFVLFAQALSVLGKSCGQKKFSLGKNLPPSSVGSGMI